MDRFWGLLEKSTVTSGILAVVFGVGAMYCAVNQIPIPDWLIITLGTIVGFFFSSKAKDEEIRTVNKRIDRINGAKTLQE